MEMPVLETAEWNNHVSIHFSQGHVQPSLFSEKNFWQKSQAMQQTKDVCSTCFEFQLIDKGYIVIYFIALSYSNASWN